MSALELELPLHLYTENKDPEGVVTGLNYSADKLVSWADCGRGDAVDCLCDQVHEKDLAAIDAWKENQFLLLEDTWVAVENGIDDSANEKQYGQACDAVRREADEKGEVAALKKEERRSEIAKLVQQSRGYLEANRPSPQEDNASGYLFALVAVGVLVYILLF